MDVVHMVCGVSGRLAKPGELVALRILPEDAPELQEHGVYQVCPQEAAKYIPRIVARLQKTPAIDHNGRPVVDRDGKPVMTLGADASPETVSAKMLL